MSYKIIKAWWHSSNIIVAVFNRDVPFIPEAEILGGANVPPFKILRVPPEKFAEYSSYYISGGHVHFMLDDKNFTNVKKIGDSDYYVCGDFNGWEKAVGDPKWLMKPSRGVFERKLSVAIGELGLKRRIGFFKFLGADGRWLEPRADAPNLERDDEGNFNLRLSIDKTGLHVFAIELEGMCGLCERIRVRFPQLGVEDDVDAAQLLLNIYSDSHLGARLLNGNTLFSIFAPRATAAYVVWKMSGDKEDKVLTASSHDGAVWTAVGEGNLEGARYDWHIDGRNRDNTTNFNLRFGAADPYANAMDSSRGPSVVKFDSSLPFPAKHFSPPRWHDLVILETHLRDILARAPAELSSAERLSFEGLAKWLKDKDCYLRKTGVNCVELQPVQEFTSENASDYEWGYMPVNWFAPSSSYATDSAKTTQNEDFAKLVDAFHAAGISVVLDVVYNHTGEPNFLERIDKEYYFETAVDGSHMNYSGCGNDIRARAPMARRLIIDSLKKLVSHYGVDGFRFDLAELLGADVLREIEVELKLLKPSLILIAEPWSFRGHISAALKETGFASWNDGFREFMVSYALGGGDFSGFKYFVSASPDTSRFCAQTVNYVESHDDKCLLDRLTSMHSHPSADDLRRYKMANALVLLSLGIPMLAEGFDLVRTKNGKHNTYKDGHENALDYARATRFTGVCQWLREAVKFRLSKHAEALRIDGMPKSGYLKFYGAESTSAAAVMFNASRKTGSPRIFAAFNPASYFVEIALESDVEVCFKQIADIDRFDMRGLENPEPIIKRGVLRLAPVSLGVWIER